MIKKIKNKFQVKDNKVLLSNFLSLSTLQMANYVIPLITFPYLVRILGVDSFGMLAMASAVVIYFQVITDYGFDLSATKEISVHRDEKIKVIEIFSSVMTIKFILLFISLILLTILVFSFETFSQNWKIYYLTFGLVIGQVLFPVWFFQGMEKMKYITILTIIAKLIFTLLIFVFVHKSEDFFMVPLLQSFGSILTGIIALYIINKDFEVKFSWQKKSTIKRYFQDGWPIFMQNFYVSLYSTTNIVILGFLTNNTVVGYYSIAARVINIFRQLFKVVSKVYYPYFAKKFAFDPKQSLGNLKKVSLVMLFISTSFMVIVLSLDDFIVKILAGSQYDERITNTLKILSFGIVFLPFFTLFTTTLVAIGESKALQTIARNTAIMSFLLATPLMFFLQENGLAYLMVFLQATIVFRYLKVILRANKSITGKGENENINSR